MPAQALAFSSKYISRRGRFSQRTVTHGSREGGINGFIPRLIELGVDRLNPIQPVGPDMQPGALKAAYGRQLSFHGGIDMQHLLPHGTPEQVTAEARRYGELLGAGGGYILGPAHLFQPDVPPENILAVYRA
jgi:uroporphyrinogen decarboxylase